MKEEIIEKLELVQVDNYHFGQTLVNGIKIYQYGDKVLMAVCNTFGAPHPHGYVMVWDKLAPTRHFYLTPELLIDLPKIEVDLILRARFK